MNNINSSVNQERRNFLKFSGTVSMLAMTASLTLPKTIAAAETNLTGNSVNPIVLPNFPYDTKAFEPYISENTISFHYGKHHSGYVNNLNALIKGTRYEGKSLESIIKKSYKNFLDLPIYNNAAQTWNHTFYWNSLKPASDNIMPPTGSLLALIEKQFGHFSDSTKDEKGAWVNPGFKEKFFDVAKSHFGSGWAWLIYNKKTRQLQIMSTKNADTPITQAELVPLLVIDVWEHAYYLDYQNSRVNYLSGIFDHLINWEFAQQNLNR